MIDILHPHGFKYKFDKKFITKLSIENGVDEIVMKFKPKTILELGSWLGKSAITFGKECIANKLKTQIVCVDTWLGSYEYWTTYKERLPTVKDSYQSFCSNVVANGLEQMIIPFRQTAKNAMNIFKFHKINFDLVYWDSDHNSAYEDIKLAISLLSSHGVIIVDDYYQHDKVKGQVDKFVNEYKIKMEKINDKVILRTNKR